MTETHVRYRDVVRRPGVLPVIAAVNFGRLASGLVPFGIVAYFVERGDYPGAGIASAVFMVVTALTAPAKGRFLTRVSPARALVPLAVAFGGFSALIVIFSAGGLPVLFSYLAIAAAACVAPPTSAVARSVWTKTAQTSAENRSLHALDSVLEEASYAVAPLITSAIWVSFGAFWAVPAGAVVAVVGTASFLFLGMRKSFTGRSVFTDRLEAAASSAEEDERKARKRSVYASTSVAGLLLPIVGLGVAMGALDIALPAWSELNVGDAAFSGVLLSLVSASGVVTGLLLGRFPPRKLSDARQYQLASAFIVLGVVIFVVSSSPVAAVVGSVLVGAGMTPMFIASFVIVGQIVAEESHTEINAALGSGFNLGSGIASVGVGALIGVIAIGGSFAITAALVACLCLTSLVLSPRRSIVGAEGVGN